MKILMTGATGLIGKELGLELFRRGHELVVVTRSRKKALLELPFPAEIVEVNLNEKTISSEHLHGIQAVIHLMGENVAMTRWNESQKRKIFNSRVLGTRNLVASFSKAPGIFISASGIGYYGDAGDQELNEHSPVGTDFLAQVCQAWEKEVDDIKEKGYSRVVKARLAMVLSSQGGALEKMKSIFQAGIGASLGSGRHWMSWIHLQDVVSLFVNCIENDQYQGALNFTSPQPIRNIDFTNELAAVLNRPLGPSVTAFALKMLYGELAQVLLSSQKAKPDKLSSLEYEFKYPELTKALSDVLETQSKGEELLEVKQYVPDSLSTVFDFFSDAQNLEKITPDNLKFHVLEMSTPQIQEGTVIDYKLSIQGVPVRWQTLIEKWNPPVGFVDRAIKGPYKSWHHTHTFEKLGSGTLISDRVRYVLPMGYVGWLTAFWKVKKDVKQIFDFRRKAVAEFFNVR